MENNQPRQPPSRRRLSTVKEVAHALRCSPEYVYDQLRAGTFEALQLPTARPDGRGPWRIVVDDDELPIFRAPARR